MDTNLIEDGTGEITLKNSELIPSENRKSRVNTAEFAINDDEKKKMLIAVLISNMICGTMILNIASFYPLYVEQIYGLNISSFMVGLALGAFQVAGILCTPIHAVTISKMGRKNSIVFGFTLILMANTALGAVSLLPYTPRDPLAPDVPVYQKNWVSFFLISCFTRFV